MRKREHKNMTLRRRLMIYLCTLVLAATGGVLLMMILTEHVFVTERKIQTDLQEQMEIVRADMTEEMMSYTEYGMNLSVQSGQMIDCELQQKGTHIRNWMLIGFRNCVNSYIAMKIDIMKRSFWISGKNLIIRSICQMMGRRY